MEEEREDISCPNKAMEDQRFGASKDLRVLKGFEPIMFDTAISFSSLETALWLRWLISVPCWSKDVMTMDKRFWKLYSTRDTTSWSRFPETASSVNMWCSKKLVGTSSIWIGTELGLRFRVLGWLNACNFKSFSCFNIGWLISWPTSTSIDDCSNSNSSHQVLKVFEASIHWSRRSKFNDRIETKGSRKACLFDLRMKPIPPFMGGVLNGNGSCSRYQCKNQSLLASQKNNNGTGLQDLLRQWKFYMFSQGHKLWPVYYGWQW